MFATDALGASANAFKYLGLLGFGLCILVWRCLCSWNIGVLRLLHGDKGQNSTRRLGILFLPVK